jgi:hypothetical protein
MNSKSSSQSSHGEANVHPTRESLDAPKPNERNQTMSTFLYLAHPGEQEGTISWLNDTVIFLPFNLATSFIPDI